MDFKGAKKYILERLENELAKDLHYHGVHHTIDVYEASIKLSEKEKLSEEEKVIVHSAALYHDAGFIFRYEHNEVLAVKLVKDILPAFKYNPKQIDVISKMILTTRVRARPSTLLEKIMSDADYDYLGREDVKTIADSLYKELQEYGVPFTEEEWIKIQIKFLNKHEYHTPSAIDLRRENKWDYIQFLKALKI